jgi:S-DNA-T family DNA segregation ATPase FtsK/SpoIIIE
LDRDADRAGIDVVGVDDVERTLRVLRWLVAEMDRRCVAEHGDGPRRTLVVVDGVGGLDERHARVNRGEAMELLMRLSVEGRGARVHVAVSAARRAEVPPALLAALDRRLVLRCPSVDDAAMAGVPAELGRSDLVPGRGWMDGSLVQVALPAPGPIAPTTAAGGGPPKGRLPVLVDADSLDSRSLDSRSPDSRSPDSQLLNSAGGWSLPIGVRADTLATATLDLGHGHALVVGPPRSGRTGALRLLARQARLGGTVVLALDGRDPDAGPADAVGVLRAALDRAGGREPALLVVDDLPDVLEGPAGSDCEALLLELLSRRDRAVRVVASADADDLPRCFSDVVRRLRAGRTGVLLRPDPDLHPPLLHTALPPHDELVPSPGRGWLVTPDGPVAVQLARVADGGA